MIDGWGRSVARASAASVSMIRLIQSSCTVVRGDCPRKTAPINTKARAAKLTVT